MLKNTTNRMMLGVLVTLVLFAVVSTGVLRIEAAAGPALDVKGLTLTTSGNATWTASDSDGSNKSVNGTVSGTDKDGCTAASAKYGTLTFKNELASGKAAYLTFDYTITANNGSVMIGNKALTSSGSHSVFIEYGLSVDLVITSGAGSKLTTAIDLTNIALTEVSGVDITFKAPVNGGTYTVDGEAITQDTVKSIVPPVTYSVVATPATGYQFVAWYNETTDSYYSSEASTTIQVDGATSGIYPVFADANSAMFQVGSIKYTDLNAANAYAKNTGDTIVLVNSGTLPAGNYEISSGVKLLIPYDDAHTANFSEKTSQTTASETPTQYTCLTLSNGTTINCYGSINVNAQQCALSTQYTGHVTGPYGAIQMNEGSQINMESGSNLYAYGYIGGDGMVWAKSGSKVYQLFQIRDWRGGTNSNSLLKSLKNNSFLFSQYYVQNIECTLRMDSGADMYVSFSVEASSTVQQVSTQLMGSGGLFKITSGYIAMKYDASTDRMVLNLYGDVTADAISVSIKLVIFNATMDTSEFIMPLPMNYTINVNAGSNVSFDQKFKVMPGTVINIEAGASATIGANGALYLYDVDDWKSGNYTYNSNIYQVGYVYARKDSPVSRSVDTDAVLKVDGTATANGPVYSTDKDKNGSDAIITGKGTVTFKTHGKTNLNEVNGSSTNLVEIACVPAVLQNATTHTAETSFQSSTNTYTFDSVHGAWITQGEAADATCTTAGHTVKKCNKCGYYETISATGHEWNYETGECDGTCGAWMITLESLNLNIAEQVELIFNFTVHEEFRQNLHVYVNEKFNVITEGEGNPLGKDNVWDRTVTVDADGTLSISQGIAAGEMTGNVNVQFKIGDQVIFIYDESSVSAAASVNKTVKDCLMAGITNNTKEAELYKAAALFGGYAQLFYGITTDRTDLVNYGLLNGTDILALNSEDVAAYSAALNAYKIASNDVNIGITATSQKVNLDAGVYLRVYFTLDDIESYESYDVTITFPSGRGTGNDTTGTFKLIREGNRCYVDIKYIPVAYWNDNYTINVTKDSQTYTVTTSVLAWARSCFYLSDNKYQRGMALAMYKFCAEADAYFTEKTPEQGGNT